MILDGEPSYTWTEVPIRGVDTNPSTARDNVDSTGCPPLPTFRLNELEQSSPKVDTDTVDAVTALSTPFVDRVNGHGWGPLSGFTPPRTARNGHREHHKRHAVDAVTALTYARTLATGSIDIVRETYYYLCEPNGQVTRMVRSVVCGRGPPR